MEKKKTNLWKEAGQLLLIMILNCFILFVVTSLEGCSILSEEEIEEIRKDAYDEGYRDAEFDNMDAANDAYKEGYGEAMSYYGVEEYHTVQCPHCGVYIWADVFGNTDGYDWG